MRNALFLAMCVLGLTGGSGIVSATPIGNLLGQLSQSDYQRYVTDLQGFGSRYLFTNGNTSATTYVENTLNGFGLTVAREHFNYYNYYTGDNVIATLPGLTDPEKILIIGAHFDSISDNAQWNAPGADDNASGTAAMLEIASIFSNYSFDYTLRFIGFNGEELGLFGSQHHATQARLRGDEIIAMINLDMIAYTGDDPDDDLEVMGDESLVRSFVTAATAYVPSLVTTGAYGDPGASDQYYFNSRRYPGSTSLLLIEDTAQEIQGGSNPYYHKTTDTADKLDFDFAFDVTQAAAATLASLAGLRTVPEPPVVLLLLSGLLLAARGRRRSARAQETRAA